MRTFRISHTPARLGARAVTMLAGVALLSPSVAASPAPPVLFHDAMPAAVESADACLDSEEVRFLALINDHRANAGLGPLAVSASLSAASAFHSADMAVNGYLAHDLIDGTSVSQNMANFGYEGSTHGENIAAGMDTAAEAMQVWQNSGDHNANMLGSQFGAIGIGRAYDAASSYGWYWTTIFGDVNDGPGWLCGEPAPPSKSLSLFQSVDGATTASDVNLRTGPAESYALVETLAPNTPMTVTGRALQAYVPVKVDGQYGWVAEEWIERGAISLEQTAAPAATNPGTAMALDAIELFSGPAPETGIVGMIPSIAVVTLTGEAQDGFLGVTYNGQHGWADAAYLEVASVDAENATLLQPAAPTMTEAAAPAEPVPAPPAGTAIGAAAMTTTNVNLRSQPSPDAMVLDVVPGGSPVTLTGSRANGYANVRIDGQAGWIDEAYLQ